MLSLAATLSVTALDTRDISTIPRWSDLHEHSTMSGIASMTPSWVGGQVGILLDIQNTCNSTITFSPRFSVALIHLVQRQCFAQERAIAIHHHAITPTQSTEPSHMEK